MHEDHVRYYRFTGPSRLDRAAHTLEGIVRGIACDERVVDREVKALTSWLGDHQEFERFHPFNEMIPRINTIIADGTIDEEERADLLWLCNKFTTDESYFCKVSADMQRLQGLLGGIAADGVISAEELRALQSWMEENSHLRTCWPYDELSALITSVLSDGILDPKEHDQLLRFFSEFIEYPGHRAIELPVVDDEIVVTGICAVCPEIIFAEKAFCFTGSSERCPRKHLVAAVEQLGGKHSPRVTLDVDFLVIGADGNPCWAYACYGRKVEAAVQLRKKGHRILLVHEYDLFDAFQDAGYRF